MHYQRRREGAEMATGLRQVLEHLQQGGGGLTDGQLLGRFVATRDEAAFAALVRRHGPMVLGVCRRVLHDFHDAEDAFQATFLVLAKKAGSLVVAESLGCWLYGVAYRTATQAHALGARRRSRERPMNDVPHPEVMPAEVHDWLPLLDRELNLLPEKYRAAIVLSDLEGQTRKEAAKLLGITEGTLSSRLARGRALLAKRLARCGVALSGGAVAVALSNEGSAAVTASLVSSTARAAVLVAAGQGGAVSTTALLLMNGVMKAMLMKKLRLVVGAVVVLLALGAVGIGYRAGGSASAQAAPPDKPLNELEALRRENEPAPPNTQQPVLPGAQGPAPPEVDYQQQADRADWSWDPKKANLLFCVRRDLRDYQADILCPKETRIGIEDGPLTVRLTDGGKEVYSFQAHDGTVFTRRGDVLYIARFSPIATGCSVVAYDFKAKKELWKTELKGIGPVDHSKYRNEVTIATTAAEDAILVTGKEAFGRYIEFVDAKSGKTVGHKVFK